MSWPGPACTDRHGLAGFRALLTGCLAQLLAGCATVPPPAPDSFLPLAADARVWHEAGGEAYAGEAAALLDDAIARVEAVHGLPFLRPPRLLVCHTPACYRRLMPVAAYTAVVLPGERLLLSPKLELEERERLPGILAHELSHLHLAQRLGHYTTALPVWFHEGLASLAGEGGGAEFSSDEEACGAWDAGRRIDFTRLDSPGKRHRAADFKLSIHQFYRQSWRFMAYLRRRAPAAFAALLSQVQAGKDLTAAVANAYNADLERLSLEFDFDSR
ncbi:MAG: hypothetical protein AB1831_07115 [Pseudomonadota bacterium]